MGRWERKPPAEFPMHRVVLELWRTKNTGVYKPHVTFLHRQSPSSVTSRTKHKLPENWFAISNCGPNNRKDY